MKRGRSNSFGGRPNKRRRVGGKKPRVARSGTTVRICHKEQILDVLVPAGGETFQVIRSFALNPGVAATFPWLSILAKSYEEYNFKKLEFYYRSTTSDAVSTSPALGTVCIATQYNSLDDGFQDKREMENTTGCVSNKISMDARHAVKVSGEVLKKKYIRSTNDAVGDLRFTDVGKTIIASSGLPMGGSFVAGQQLGELWVKYDVELSKPVWNTGAFGSDHWSLAPGPGVLAATPLGTASFQNIVSLAGSSITLGTTYNFPPSLKEGNWLFHWQVRGNAAAWTGPTITPTNCVLKKAFEVGTVTSVGSSGGVAAPSATMVFIVSITASNAKVTWGSAGTIPTSVVAADLWVTRIDDNCAWPV